MKKQNKKVPYILLQKGQMIYQNLKPFNNRQSFNRSKLNQESSNNTSIQPFQTPMNRQKRGKFNKFMKQKLFKKDLQSKKKSVRRQLSMKTKSKQIHTNLKKQQSRKSLVHSDINLLKNSVSKINKKLKISFRGQRKSSQINYSKLIDSLTQKFIENKFYKNNQENYKKQIEKIESQKASQSRKKLNGYISMNRKKTVQKVIKSLKQIPHKSKFNIKDSSFKAFIQEKNLTEKIINQIDQKKDAYEFLKQYIDFIQENKVAGLIQNQIPILVQKHLKKFLLINRLLICLTLYLYLNQKLKQEKIYLAKIFEKQLMSYQMIQKYFEVNFFDLKLKTKFKLFDQQNIDEKTQKNLNEIEQSNKRSIKQIKQILQLTCTELCAQIQKFEQFEEELKFKEGQKLILNIFEEYFCQKGIIVYSNSDQKIRYQIVLDLDETLIYFDEKLAKVFFRPYLDFFLQECSKLFDLSIFTASLQEYADEILNHLETDQKYFTKKFYRKNLDQDQLKDIQKLGFDLKQTILIDDKKQNLKLQKDNSILIPAWYGDKEDETLMKLYHYLLKLSQHNGSVQDFLKANDFNQRIQLHLLRISIRRFINSYSMSIRKLLSQS